MAVEWYLVRTKTGQERKASDNLTRFVNETFLPLMKTRVYRWGRLVESIVPLFTSYLFAAFDLEREYNYVRHTSGVQYVVHYGDQPPVVPKWILDEIRARCAAGPVKLCRDELFAGDSVRVVNGPFRQLEGIFERRVSGSERVAILLSAMGSGARVVLPASMVEKTS